ncbi:hypothetical protein T09_8747, partial [Trichinella sp. T9]
LEQFAEIFNELPFLTNTFNCTWRKSKQYDNAYDMINVLHDTVCIFFECPFLVSIYLFFNI